MSTKKGAKLLEDSAEKPSYGSTSNSGPSTGTKPKTKYTDLTSSAPAVLEPSKDASRPSKPYIERTLDDSSSPPINPWRTLVTCSCPEPIIRLPPGLEDEMNNYADDQQIIDEQLANGHPNICSSLVYGYKNTAITMRNSIFIHIFQILFSVIPVSAIVMAVMFEGKCKESPLLPAYGGLTGFIGLVFIGFWMSLSCYHRLHRSSMDIHKLLSIAIFLIFILSVIVEICIFGAMSYSFDQQASNYCNKTFYYYAFYKHIATGASAAFATILYLPGSLHYIRCHCFLE